jgi:adenine-specific DNA-methyltransferase
VSATPYHAATWATALTLRQAPDSPSGLSRAIGNARVDLNPHQVDAALFALRSPLSTGAILADEVGLGKTIEAGLVMTQRWAEGRRRILVIVPASLRKQWQQELSDKFFLPAVVLDGASFRARGLVGSPLDQANAVVIVSYQLVAAKQADVTVIPWDLVVLDEAHRLRNIYQPGARTARAVTAAVTARHKLLLTATPLQNSLLELYGLVSVADARVFGDLGSFREQFMKASDEDVRNHALRQRLSLVCHRTLRRQVLEYVKFTQRIPITQEFRPSDAEQSLYDQVSSYLQRADLLALPTQQRTLITMILRKLLASSSFAIGDTLRALIARLEGMAPDAATAIATDFEELDEIADEWGDDEGPADQPEGSDMLSDEIRVLRAALATADGIAENAKGQALLKALVTAFARAAELGAARKAVVFTESRRTQGYLVQLLEAAGWKGRVVVLNGDNADAGSKAIHKAWLTRHATDGQSTGVRTADVKAAIVEEFRDRAEILVGTEAAAEGVNLQFCSLVVNYDLPWNPQRVEQRIGRCHRYGQKHDVVVVNFLNQRNEADQRVFQLLSEKLRLFDGVFGVSDDILGALESGVDIERRIARVYQECRTSEEITAAFDQLQVELDEQVRARMAETREAVFANFDQEVQERLSLHRDRAIEALDERGRMLLALTRFELGSDATFEAEAPRFGYHGTLAPHTSYHLDWREAERLGDVFYRLDHALARAVLDRALARALAPARLDLRYGDHGSRIAAIEPWVGKSGWLSAAVVTVHGMAEEQVLILAGRTDEGEVVDDLRARRLLALPASVAGAPDGPGPTFDELAGAAVRAVVRGVEEKTQRHFDVEVIKLDRWSDDLKLGLEREIKDFDQAIREARTASRLAGTLEERVASQRAIRDIESKRRSKRADLFAAQDRVDAQRDDIIEGLERLLVLRHEVRPLYTVRWTLR